MKTFTHLSLSSDDAREILRFTPKKGRIQGTLRGLGFVDADTSQFVLYVPSLEVSGYGESLEKAKEMLHASLNELGIYLLTLPHAKAVSELKSMGWAQEKFASKQFTHSYVDEQGVLQNFSIANDKVDRYTLTAA